MCVPVEGWWVRGEIGAGLEERLKNGVRLFEVVVDDIDEEVGVHDVRDQLARRRVWFVVLRPLPTKLIGFILHHMSARCMQTRTLYGPSKP